MNQKQMKRLYIERFYLNRADDEYPMTVRIILQMKDDVDRHLFEEAVAAAQTRYPYLCVKLGVERDADGSEHYVYHDNPRPWKVTDYVAGMYRVSGHSRFRRSTACN